MSLSQLLEIRPSRKHVVHMDAVDTSNPPLLSAILSSSGRPVRVYVSASCFDPFRNTTSYIIPGSVSRVLAERVRVYPSRLNPLSLMASQDNGNQGSA